MSNQEVKQQFEEEKEEFLMNFVDRCEKLRYSDQDYDLDQIKLEKSILLKNTILFSLFFILTPIISKHLQQ
ncbi:hypothetical protein ABK040_012566 [Willaertia magna]